MECPCGHYLDPATKFEHCPSCGKSVTSIIAFEEDLRRKYPIDWSQQQRPPRWVYGLAFLVALLVGVLIRAFIPVIPFVVLVVAFLVLLGYMLVRD